LLQTHTIAFCAVDTLVSVAGRIQPGFDEFSAALERANLPLIWVTSRTRLQMDQPRRKLGHAHPFIAEGGCGIYVPDGYFHLPGVKSIRLGRFPCVPIAEPRPAASGALETLSSDLGVAVVPLQSLSPAEFARNTGLPSKEAGLARHRDFDELFFFAGTRPESVEQFMAEARTRKLQVRKQGALWSLAAGANLKKCVEETFKLYQRSLRSRLSSFGIATSSDEEAELLGACQKGVLLTDSPSQNADRADTEGDTENGDIEDGRSQDNGRENRERSRRATSLARIAQVPIRGGDAWDQVLAAMRVKA
jgi:mannosyl-3-phosphoglycerate phosphatase